MERQEIAAYARNNRAGTCRARPVQAFRGREVLFFKGDDLMAERNDEISTLNTLIATDIDSVTGYEDSATNIDNERFREIFRERATERQRIIEDLRGEVRRLGGDPEDG